MNNIIFFLLFVLPFVVFPFGISPFESAKVILSEVLIVGCVVLALYKFQIKQFVDRKYLLFFILLALYLAQMLFYPSTQLFFGNAFRMQGVFLLLLLTLFALFSSVDNVKLPSPKVILVLLFLQLLGAIFIEGRTDMRAVGTLGEANALAASVVFIWPFLYMNPALSFPRKRESRFRIKSRMTAVKSFNRNFLNSEFMLKIVGLVLTGLIILMSGSRSGMIAFGLQVVFLVLYKLLRLSLLKTTIIVVVLLLVSLTLPFIDKTTVYERRDDVWKGSLIAGYEHPVIGWGFGNTEKALEKYNDKLHNTAHGYYVDSSHNIFLDWWVQGGIVGLSLLITLLYGAIKVFIKKNEAVYLIILIGLVTAMSFNPVSVITLVQFWWLIGQALHRTNS